MTTYVANWHQYTYIYDKTNEDIYICNIIQDWDYQELYIYIAHIKKVNHIFFLHINIYIQVNRLKQPICIYIYNYIDPPPLNPLKKYIVVRRWCVHVACWSRWRLVGWQQPGCCHPRASVQRRPRWRQHMSSAVNVFRVSVSPKLNHL